MWNTLDGCDLCVKVCLTKFFLYSLYPCCIFLSLFPRRHRPRCDDRFISLCCVAIGIKSECWNGIRVYASRTLVRTQHRGVKEKESKRQAGR